MDNQMSFDTFHAVDFLHYEGARYLVPAIGLAWANKVDAQIVADRYDGRVIDRRADTNE